MKFWYEICDARIKNIFAKSIPDHKIEPFNLHIQIWYTYQFGTCTNLWFQEAPIIIFLLRTLVVSSIYDWLSKNLPFLSFTPIGVRHTAGKPWIRAFQRYIIHWGSMTRMSSNLRRRRGSRGTRENSLKKSFLRNRALKFLDLAFLFYFCPAGSRGGPKSKIKIIIQ